MSDTTLEPPHVSTSGDGHPPDSENGTRSFLRRHVWWFVALGVIVLSAIIARVTNTRPGYDPYGWLIWGYQTLHLHLDLGGAPSWKPLPLLFTIPFSLFGHYALWLWMVTAEAAAFAGSIFAGRIAYRVVNSGGDPDRRYRYAAIAAALFAGLGMYGIQDNINGAPQQLPALRAERAVRSDDRHARPGGDRHAHAGPPPLGDRAAHPRGPWPS